MSVLVMALVMAAANTTAAGPRAIVLRGDNTLAVIDAANPSAVVASVPITGLNAGDTLVGIDFRPNNGFLYGLGHNSVAGTVQLYAISYRTGHAAPVGTTGTFIDASFNPVQIFGPSFGFDFEPNVDRIRVVTSSGQNFRIEPNSGAFVDGNLGMGAEAGLNMDGPIAFGATVAAAAYTNNAQFTGTTTLYTLDPVADTLHIQNSPISGQQIVVNPIMSSGASLDFTEVGGFDILPGVNASSSGDLAVGVGYAALMVGGMAQLYTIDLTGASATLLGPIGDGLTPVVGLALQGADFPGGVPAYALSSSNRLLRFNTAAPIPGGSISFITGVTAGETLVGIDWRPRTGQLYALGVNVGAGTGSATLYRVDPRLASVIAIGTPGNIANGMGTPIDLMGATDFGFDFDPAADRARIVGNNGLNALIDPDTAAASVDTPINGLPQGSTGLVSAAYTNSYGQAPGAGSATLYAIDAVSDRLFIQAPPASGTLSTAVPLTFNGAPLDVPSGAGFDIPAAVAASTANEPAIGRAFIMSGANGTLWQIDLASGAAIDRGSFGFVLYGLALGDGPGIETSTTLSSSANPGIVTEPVTVTATVAAGASGFVAFTRDGTPIVGCEILPIDVNSGTSSCTITSPVTATHTIAASYGGYDPHRASVSAPLSQAFSQVTTTTTLQSSANPVIVAQDVTFTATVTPADAAGTIAFTAGGLPIAGCAARPIAAGVATCTTSFATPGGVPIVAAYSGSVTQAVSSSAPLAQAVQEQVTTTVLTATPSTSPFGRPITLTARVSPVDAGTSGAVTFTADGQVLAVVPMTSSEALQGDPLSHVVSIEVSTLSLGEHQLVATFSGDVVNLPSTSAPVTVTIDDTLPLTQYFAEGATGAFFQTDLGILNTSKTHAATVEVTLFPETGAPIVEQFELAPLARRSVDVNALVPAGQGVSTLVTSTQPVAATRQMTWGTPVYGSTLESGIAQPSATWYFAEGATNVFSLFYLIQNPGTTDATVTLKHLIEGGAAPIEQIVDVPAASRRTFFINEVAGLESAALSTVITSNVPVVAERAMYLNTTQPLGAGAASRGARELGTSWSLAEGATGFFRTYLLLGNPNADATSVTVRYQLPDGTAFDKAYDIPAASRRTIDVTVEDDRLVSTAVSMSVTSTLPIVSERAMWWGEPFVEGSVAIGSLATGTAWAIGEGAEGGVHDESTFVLVSNAAADAGTVRFTVVYDDGTNDVVDYAVAGSARLTVRIFDDFVKARDAKFSVLVESVTAGVPIAVEVARYQSGGSFLGAGGAAQATRIQ